MPIFVFFIIIPLIELALFATVSEEIGIWTTLLLAFLTAIIGGALVKQQGIQTIISMRYALDKGKMPLNEIFDGFCLVAAGALLITPGFLTDTIGFALLTPPFRSLVRQIIRKHTQWEVSVSPNNNSRVYNDETIIEGEYEKLDPDDKLR
ncbi:MAG: hypothetical protein CMH26_01020 [Micavibrio sp.]|nr:hypothetical protein [Micavibrio sp.]|tara:strand:- start:2228 stop:2677 length:450 start_codon:yes stop_codon:yes gene_type:complete